MEKYGKQSFDGCLVAITSELVRVEQENPDWPEDTIDAARIVSDKAERLLTTSLRHCRSRENCRTRIIEEAVHTAAVTLRFLLNTSSNISYAMQRGDDMEVYPYEEFD